MDLEINRPIGPLSLTAKEVKLAQLDNLLYLGQALKAVVLSPLNNGEVTININGQNVNARTSYPFTPGDTLNVKVIQTENEIVLQVQHPANEALSAQKTLQNALMHALPKQSPPTSLLEHLGQLVDPKQAVMQQLANKLPQLSPEIVQQIKTLLATIPNVAQLPQHIAKAVEHSGVFLESALLQLKPGMVNESLHTDLKAQYLKLLNNLPIDLKSTFLLAEHTQQNANPVLNRASIPLPGAIPQPVHKEGSIPLMQQSPEAIQTVIHEQVTQALSRITANQITHLVQHQFNPDDNKTGFLIMMDIPVKTPQNDIDVIPLMIKQRKATATQPSKWSITFALSLSELGDMQGTVTLNENYVHLKINSERQETIDTLQHYQSEVSSLIEQLGLKMGGYNLQLGLEKNQIETDNFHLLDIRI